MDCQRQFSNMSQDPPDHPTDPASVIRGSGLNVVQPTAPTGNPSRVEDMTLRLLRDMRAEHSASMQAMTTELTATRRVFVSMEKVFDRLDTLQADLTAFRAETEKNFRRLESDILTTDGQNMQRQYEILEAVRRISEIENSLAPTV